LSCFFFCSSIFLLPSSSSFSLNFTVGLCVPRVCFFFSTLARPRVWPNFQWPILLLVEWQLNKTRKYINKPSIKVFFFSTFFSPSVSQFPFFLFLSAFNFVLKPKHKRSQSRTDSTVQKRYSGRNFLNKISWVSKTFFLSKNSGRPSPTPSVGPAQLFFFPLMLEKNIKFRRLKHC
jgi:hypothetical protein